MKFLNSKWDKSLFVLDVYAFKNPQITLVVIVFAIHDLKASANTRR